MDQLLSDKGLPLNTVIHIDVPKQVIIDRMAKRFIHPASGRTYHLTFNPPKREGRDDVTGEPLIRRSDDHPEAIRKRLEQYESATSPLIRYYSERGVLKTFTGESSDQIYPLLDDLVAQLLAKK